MSALPLRKRLLLTVITDTNAPLGIIASARAALRGGAPAVQLRAKRLPTRELVELAIRLREATRRHGALLVINDRIDVALAAGADGAHLGDDDLPLEAARRLAPADFLLGRSADTPEEAAAAERAGADYVGIGPVFPTPSKDDAGPVIGLEGVRAVRASITLPLIAIGGIAGRNAAEVVRAGADGVAVVGAVVRTGDPERAARALLAALREA